MADKIPVKAIYTLADVTSLGEFNPGDTIPVANGGTGAVDATEARTNLGLASMAIQESDNVEITGGTIDNTVIGGTTPAAVNATTLSATGNTTLGDATTDTVTVSGSMGIGGASSADRGLGISNTALVGAGQYGAVVDVTGSSSGSTLTGFYGRVSSAAQSYTVSDVRGFYCATVALGTGSKIGNVLGIDVQDQTAGTNNYGIYSRVATSTITATINNIVVTSNVVTVSTVAAHGLMIGETATVTATANTGINGSATVLSTPSIYTFTYAKTLGNIPSVADTGTVALVRNKWNIYASGSAPNYFAGNVGVGALPSAWGPTYKVTDIGSTGGFYGTTVAAGMAGNAYNDGTNWKAKVSGIGSLYNNGTQGHIWWSAPSVAAGATQTFVQVMALDASGNLGLGVTPSAWTSTWRAFEFGAGNGISSDQASAIHVTSNAYWNGTSWVYKASNKAANYYSQNGNHYWRTAPSGTAGQPISFTQAMTLDVGGNLHIGATVANVNANSISLYANAGTVYANHLSGTAPGVSYAIFNYNGNGIGSITQSGTTAIAYNTLSDHRLKENVRPASASRFNDIEFVDFEWVDGRHDCGVIAHQLQSVYPDLVIGEKDATEIRAVEIEPAIPAVTEQVLVTEAVFNDDGEEIEPAVYETVEITPAVEAVMEDQTFPVYQQVNHIGLIGRMGTRIQIQDKQLTAQAELIAKMEARLALLEAA